MNDMVITLDIDTSDNTNMTEHRKNYYFSDFTSDNYRRLIDIAKENFCFTTFSELESNNDKRFVLWRHDIDMSPQRAVKLAEIESERKVYSTYFLHLHSAFYNAFEADVVECVKRILNLGHHLGLHFDNGFYSDLDLSSFEHWLRIEADILESVFDVSIKVFSFHNPTPFAIASTDLRYAGIINVTSSYFREDVTYCSDSNGYWRFRRLEDVLRDPQVKRLQVLTHPVWWQDEVMSPKQRILRCINGRAKKTIEGYDKLLMEFDRENVDQ